MRCIDKTCEYRELNGGNENSDYYFCKLVGITVEDGVEECLIDKFDKEKSK